MRLTPTDRPYYYATQSDGSLAHTGRTEIGEVTATALDVSYTVDVNEHLATLSTWSDQFEPLPDTGEWLEAGNMYRHGDGVVIVRQSHTRTEHDPADISALFLVAREPGTGIEWIAGEQVQVGTRREYDGVLYQALQAHVTEFAPPLVPALWEPCAPEGVIPEWVQPSGAHDAYQLGDRVTHNGKVWESTAADNVWAPGVFGWVVVP